MSEGRKCVFCGAVPVTREHVFADWMGPAFMGIIGDQGTIEIRSDDGTVKSFPSVPFTHTIRRFCEGCNGAWMGHKETLVKPFLTPMITGGFPNSLSPSMQLDLADWAVKTALVLNYLRPNRRPIPDSEHPDFRASSTPLARQLVWIGHRDPRRDKDGSSRAIIERRERWRPGEDADPSGLVIELYGPIMGLSIALALMFLMNATV
jgi:hypothetical protein